MIMGTLGFLLVGAFVGTGSLAVIAIVKFVRAELSFRRDPPVGARTAATLKHLISGQAYEVRQVAIVTT